jgi:hypothetical protein
VDKATGSANVSFMNVDTGLGEICLAGATTETADAQVYPPVVVFFYQALGDITQATDTEVKADFALVNLTLDISEGIEPYSQTIQLTCKLEASLRKEGERDKVKLRCDLGENYSAFPDLTSGQIAAINDAYKGVKHAKASSKKGKLKVTNDGEVTDDVGLSCDFD